ncbi:hypothetical protein Ptr902_13458 [Pyrenophora tritici-repentis]|nr:hypothetical protein Ptr902_13458 [Pyrenophora tritici-repentis]
MNETFSYLLSVSPAKATLSIDFAQLTPLLILRPVRIFSLSICIITIKFNTNPTPISTSSHSSSSLSHSAIGGTVAGAIIILALLALSAFL